MYVVAEEAAANDESTGNNVVIVSSAWLTPRKMESFWPNSKFSAQYNKLLLRHEYPGEDWPIIQLRRKFFETDDILLARKKAKEAEINSDVTDGEERTEKRKIRPSKRILSSDDEENDIFNINKSLTSHTQKLVKIFENPGSVQPSLATDHDKKHTCKVSLQPMTTEEVINVPTPVTQLRVNSLSADDYSSTPSQNIGGLSGSSQPSLSTEENAPTTPHTKSRSISVSADDFVVSTPVQNIGSLSAFEHKSLRLLTTIVEQNNQILSWIRQQNEFNTNNLKNTDLKLPIEFPLHEDDEMKTLETHLENDTNLTELCNYFTSFRAISRTGTVNTILKHCLTNKLAAKYSYRGKKGKLAFEGLSLRTAIIRTVKRMFKLPTEKDIENDIKIWLKHAPQRLAIQEKKSNVS